MKTINELLNKIENLDWVVTKVGDNVYYVSQFSPAGQDFNIQIEGDNVEELLNSIYQAYEIYDVSEETYLWLDNTGHGTNGAPYDMKDVYEDMEACREMIYKLWDEL